MSVATQQTEVRAVYTTCRLGKSELNRLFSLAPEGIPAASVQVSTQRDSTRYSAGMLTDLVDHVRNSNASGNLDKWDNLAFEADDGTGDRRVTVGIDSERTEVQVSGRDATWVHGQAARIELFLDGTGGEVVRADKGRRLKTRIISLNVAILLNSFAMATGISVLASDLVENVTFGNMMTLALGATVGAVPLLLALLAIVGVMKRVDRAVLKPTMDIPHGSWWSRASSADRIALGALAVATLSFFVALATLGKDLLK
ncbi:hypothetical protein ACFU5Y_04230 [Streptomyces gardneri]|uniref:hypothetical protein n=1 Tax=Streptomyces gardneri TaxID=66892 RepID=UPI0036A635C1